MEAVREYIATLGETDQGWLKGLSDPNIGRALALIHGDIAASWSVDILAKEVGLSRSAFMDRFTQLIGMPPIHYLTVWRLEIAKRHLRESRMSILRLLWRWDMNPRKDSAGPSNASSRSGPPSFEIISHVERRQYREWEQIATAEQGQSLFSSLKQTSGERN